MDTWLSLHLHLSGDRGAVYSPTGDWVIARLVAPAVDECRARGRAKSHFFVRYTEPGPHVRLRIQPTVGTSIIDLRTLIEDYVSQTAESKDEWTPGQRAEAPPQLPRIEWRDYVPEVKRYGGREAIQIAEQFFCASSELAIALARAGSLRERVSRLGQALLVMVIALQVFCTDQRDAAQFCDRYIASFLRVFRSRLDATWPHVERFDGASPKQVGRQFDAAYERQSKMLATHVHEAWRGIIEGVSISREIDEYVLGIKQLVSDLKRLSRDGRLDSPIVANSWGSPIRAIVPSFMHMTNNRLGITTVEEAYVAHLIRRALDDKPLISVGLTHTP